MWHSLPYDGPAHLACMYSRNQKTDIELIAMRNQCLLLSIFITTMNAGLLGLATRRGVIHVEEIGHETKNSSVGRAGRNIFQLLQNHCLRYLFKFPSLF